MLLFGEHRKELSGGYRKTTNNRMELTAVIKGLEALKEKCAVEVYSDSKYVVDALSKGWAARWRPSQCETSVEAYPVEAHIVRR